MMNLSTIRRGMLAASLAATALCGATAAQADPAPAAPSAQCAAQLDRVEATFRVLEARVGYEEASEWWQHRWAAYYNACGAGR
jgi:hypothetical protein